MAVPDKRALRKTIQDTGGVISAVAEHYNVNRSTVYRWLEAKDLRDEVTKSRANMRAVATDVIYQRLMHEDADKAYEAARFVHLHMGEDGQALTIPPRLLGVLLRMGLSGADIMVHLEEILLSQEALGSG